ncbi:MAG: prolyl oligopeptidase family serine peptidase [Sedimentisphaerales bacterium]|nr:prolyl oligopeptidase family serine peptidase [Sedimentisphaerales bacterium]
MKNMRVLLFAVTLTAFWADISLCNDFARRLEKDGIETKKSVWYIYDRYDFTYDTRQCIVVTTKESAGHRPWIWRARFFGHEPQTDLALLEKGFHLVYMDVANLFGSPIAVNHWNAFYHYLTEHHGFHPRVALEGMSRGGLIVYNWAGVNPEKVACIYADNPVCDFKSWPAARGKGKSHQPSWEACLKAYGLTEEQALTYKHNPVDNLEPLTRSVVPVLHVCGTADTVVPMSENTDIIEQRYQKLGGKIIVIRKPGVDHHPHSLEDPKPIVDFILTHTTADYDKFHYCLRHGLTNSRIKFLRQKKGRVAFLGGSITHNPGWRNMVCQYLQHRFPETEFDVIAAGIPSMGSTPGAFRLTRDVFKNGPVDLLFEEAAVNDTTNGRTDIEQIRGMEGIVRHARTLNPEIDIILMYFVDPEKMKTYNEGSVPAVIRNHEKVAEYYQLPSLNLALEVTERINAGQFDWPNDFRNLHPSPFGQNVYFRSMKHLLDTAWTTESIQAAPNPMPDKPLDSFSYYHGRYVDISKAELVKGFTYDAAWNPGDGKGIRKGFVNVPVLKADRPGAELRFNFEGTAVGIFVTCGPNVGIIEYSIDQSSFRQVDQFTQWSANLHLPWAYILDAELSPGVHELTLRTTDKKNEKSCGYACRIVHFLVN